MAKESTAQIEDLRQLVADEQLVVVVGSGVSVATTNGADTASWQGLIKSGIQQCHDFGHVSKRWVKRQTEALEDALADGDLVELLSVAEQVTQRLNAPHGEFARWLRESIGGDVLPVKDDSVIKAIDALNSPIITTNYDDLLERATGHLGVTWKDQHKLTRIIRREDRDILHVHGKWDVPDSVILGVRDYEKIKHDTHTQALMQAVGFADSLLFVGCGEGLNDPNFGNLLDWIGKVKASDQYRSYRLARECEVAELQKQHPPEQRLFVLPYGEDFADLPKFLQSLVPKKKKQAGKKSRKSTLPTALNEYLQQLCTDHAKLTMIGLGSSLPLSLPIDDAYVPLRTCHTSETAKRGRFDVKAFHETEQMERDVRLEHVFLTAKKVDGRGVLLLGDPGAGKTTGARQLCWRLASGRETATHLGLHSGALPVFIRLRNLHLPETEDGEEQVGWANPEQFVRAAWKTETADDPNQPAVDSNGLLTELWNHAGPVLWIFDGLDEVVREDVRDATCQQISRLLTDREQDHVLVTSRYQGYIGKVDLGDDFVRFEVQPLEDSQATVFIHKWYRTAYERLGLEQSTGNEKARGLVELLEQPDYRVGRMPELRSNPLLLTILCLVFHEDSNLPRSRARLYERCLKVMLETWRGQMHARHGGRSYNPDAARQVLASVAWWMHEERDRRSVPLVDMEARAAQAMRLYPNSGLGGRGDEFIRLMREDSGVVAASGSGFAEFLHLTFQEYLAALFAVQHGRAEELAQELGESWWQEVILLALAQGTPAFSQSFFTAVLKGDGVEKHGGFLDRCLQEAEPLVVTPFVEHLGRRGTSKKRRVALLRHLKTYNFDEVVDLCRKWASSSKKDELSQLAREILGRAGDVSVKVLEAELQPFSETVDPKTGITFVRIPAGSFQMGDETWDHTKPIHDVTITQAFDLGRYPVTNAEYAKFLAATQHEAPSEWKERRFNQPQQPVVGVSWDDAQKFCEWAECRLPTEAEWEYACRAGTTTAYSFGDDESQLPEYAWFAGNSGDQTQPVGGKRPNPWGLHDMHGNVREWCQDSWHDTFEGAPADGSAWIDSQGSDRVVRGGGWADDARGCRCAFRDGWGPGYRARLYGFRLVLSSSSTGQSVLSSQ